MPIQISSWFTHTQRSEQVVHCSLFKKILITKQRRRRFGFTLIELMVAISIIALLSTIAVAAYSTAQIKVRDTKRKADLNALKTAIETARSNNSDPDIAPGCNPASATCYLSTMNDLQNPALVPTYIKKMPIDPIGMLYRYRPFPSGCSGVSAITGCTSYAIEACLENDNEPLDPPKVIAISGNICLGSGHVRQYSVFSPN